MTQFNRDELDKLLDGNSVVYTGRREGKTTLVTFARALKLALRVVDLCNTGMSCCVCGGQLDDHLDPDCPVRACQEAGLCRE